MSHRKTEPPTSRGVHQSSEPPPPYSATAGHPSASYVYRSTLSGPPSLFHSINHSSQLISGRHNAQCTEQIEEDEKLLETIRASARDFLANAWRHFPISGSGPRANRRDFIAELYVAPETAVPYSDGWCLSGADERRKEDVYVQESRVSYEVRGETGYFRSSKGRKDQEWSFSDEARADTKWSSELAGQDAVEVDGLLWWQDEEQARRLANRLAAEFLDSPLDPAKSASNGAVVYKRKCNAEDPPTPSYKESLVHPPRACEDNAAKTGSVKTVVKAEEFTFRRENEMGLWESASGWTIIITCTFRC